LQLNGGNIVDSSGHVYTYDNAKDELLDDAKPAAVVNSLSTAFQVRVVRADATTAATATAVTTALLPQWQLQALVLLPAAATPVTMALTPFIANTSTINYQSKAGAKLWKQSSKGLYGDSEELLLQLVC
jgi:hypothetical protein